MKPDHVIFLPEYKQFIEATFHSTKGIYYSVYEGKKKVGLFPFFHIQSTGFVRLFTSFDIFSDKVVSAAFYDYGGWLGRVADPIAVIKDIVEKTGIDSIEIRGGNGTLDLPKRTYKRCLLHLNNKKSVWNGIQKEKRKAIRKAKREHVEVRDVLAHEVQSLYRLYLINARTFGELPLPRLYFENFFVYLQSKGLGKIVGAYVDGKLVSAVLGFMCGNRIHIKLALSLPEYLAYRVNDAAHWKFIEYAIDNGYTIFDFGRTRDGSGQLDYKKKWGCEVEDLAYYYYSTKPIPIIDPTNPKYRFFIWCQKRVPLWFGAMVSSRLREVLGI